VTQKKKQSKHSREREREIREEEGTHKVKKEGREKED
jgi:hypothetical protein